MRLDPPDGITLNYELFDGLIDIVDALPRLDYTLVALQSDVAVVVFSTDIGIWVAVGIERKEVAECHTLLISHLLFYSECRTEGENYQIYTQHQRVGKSLYSKANFLIGSMTVGA